MKQTRRLFIREGLAGAILLGTGNLVVADDVSETVKAKVTRVVNPFHLGMAGFTFSRFDIDITLKTMQRLDLHYLSVKDFHLPLNSTDKQIEDFKDKCASYNVIGYIVGPINMHSEAEVDEAFEYAKRVGVKKIIGVPDVELLPYVDKRVKEYDFNYAIHLHGPDKNVYKDAASVWRFIKDLDPRIGMCLDVGHDFRNGCDPSLDLQKYHTRVFDMHIKDETEASRMGVCTIIGRGLINFPALIRTMRKVNYTGMCSLEYEADKKDPFLGIAESIGYFKALCDTPS